MRHYVYFVDRVTLYERPSVQAKKLRYSTLAMATRNDSRIGERNRADMMARLGY